MHSNLDAHLTEWIRILDELSELEYDSSFEWRGETDDSVASYSEDKRDLQLKAEDALTQASRAEGVDPYRLLARAREICQVRKEKGHWGTEQCYASIRNAEARLR